MEIGLIFFALGIAFLIGYILMRRLWPAGYPLDPCLRIFLGGGLGLGISAQITFYTLIIFDQLNKSVVVILHILLLAFLIVPSYFSSKKTRLNLFFTEKINPQDFLLLGIISLVFIPIDIYAQLYPMGGWDAWSVWNLKAKFIFSGEDRWKNMLDPVLWRSSPHYPLLLPLINVWGWSFLSAPAAVGPLIVSILFTLLTAGTLIFGLKPQTGPMAALVSGLLLLCLAYFVQLATSQYCDIVFAFYLLAGIIALKNACQQENKSFAFLAGLFLGFLSFAKSEGVLAMLILAGLSIFYLRDKKLWGPLFLGSLVTSLPTLIFERFFSPGNQTFINGLVSSTQPSDMYRLKMIFAFLWANLNSQKWNGLWAVLAVGLIFSKGRCFQREFTIIPLFLLVYLSLIFAYYYINTYFKIAWWMQVTLDRIFLGILPVIIFWIFSAVWKKDSNPLPGARASQ